MTAEKNVLEEVTGAVLAGDEGRARRSAEQALAEGLDPLVVIRRGVSQAMEVVGTRFGAFEIYLPELVSAADAAKAVMAVLLPEIAADRRGEAVAGRIVIGTVAGDVHDIGKNLVSAVLSAARFEVHDLGTDVPAKAFADAVRDLDAEVVALSSLLTTSMQYQRDVIDYLTDMGLRDRCFVIVGGGPVTPAWTRQIDADGYGRRATDAVELCRRLVAEERRPPLLEPIIVGPLAS